MKYRPRFYGWLVLLATGNILGTSAQAVTTNWNTNSNGVFTNPANWTNPANGENVAPGAADTAVFNRGSAVTLNASFIGSAIGQPPPVYTTSRLIIRSNSVGLARGTGVNGPSYVAGNASVDPSNRAIIVGQQTGDVATLTTTIPVSAAAATIADATGTSAALNVNSNSLTLTGSGTAGGPSVTPLYVGNHGFGTLSISNGAQLKLTADYGNVIAGEAVGSVGGILVSGSGSELQIGSAAFFSDNDLYVGNSGTGTLTVTGGAKVSDDSGFVAFQNASTGSVTVDGTGSVWSNRINLLVSGFGLPGNVSDGTITVSNGGTIEALQQMLVEPAGKVQGNGFITGTVQNNGLVAPGFPLGALSVTGDFAQTSSGHLQIQIAGTGGTQYDQLLATGAMQLAGALDISFSSFSPAGGDSFNILDFTGHTGTFTSVTLPPLSGGLTWDTSQLYTTGIISVVGPHVVGDYNGNGIVDAADYTVWRDSLGSTSSLAADGDASGVIDVGDYGVWKANFGSHAGIGAGAHAAVPEPASLWMFLAGILAMCSHRLTKFRKLVNG
jgi:T5SS/PEP-CTERM-associated repeat protein